MQSNLKSFQRNPSKNLYSKNDQRKPSRPPTGSSGQRRQNLTINNIDLENTIVELQSELQAEKEAIEDLKRQISESQERYVMREQEYRKTIEEYDAFLKQDSAPVELMETTERNLQRINQMHSALVEQIQGIQGKTVGLLQSQEKEIIKDYNSVLNEKYNEINQKKIKKLQKMETHNEKETKLTEELEWRKSRIENVESKNKELHKENSELKVQVKAHENDQKILQKELETITQKNSFLKKKLQKAKSNYSPDKKDPIKLEEPERSESNPFFRHEQIVQKLKRMLELERKNLRIARTAYAKELENKTELEGILRKCVEDVKNEIAKKRSEQRLKSQDTEEDLEKVIEVLLSQVRVLTLLYDKTFPPRAIADDQLVDFEANFMNSKGFGNNPNQSLSELEDSELDFFEET